MFCSASFSGGGEGKTDRLPASPHGHYSSVCSTAVTDWTPLHGTTDQQLFNCSEEAVPHRGSHGWQAQPPTTSRELEGARRAPLPPPLMARAYLWQLLLLWGQDPVLTGAVIKQSPYCPQIWWGVRTACLSPCRLPELVVASARGNLSGLESEGARVPSWLYSMALRLWICAYSHSTLQHFVALEMDVWPRPYLAHWICLPYIWNMLTPIAPSKHV